MARSRFSEDQVIDADFLSEVEFSERHPHSLHDSTAHLGIDGTPSIGDSWIYDGTNWGFQPVAGGHDQLHGLESSSDHNVDATAVNRALLMYNSTAEKWIDEPRDHSLHNNIVHKDVIGTPTDGQIQSFSGDTATWSFIANAGAGTDKELPDVTFLGNIMNYPNSVGVGGAYDIQYTRVWLHEDSTVSKIGLFLRAASGTQDIRFAIYDQTASNGCISEPHNKVAETAAVSVSSIDAGAYVRQELTSSYVIPTTGYYWLAFMASSTALKFAGSGTFIANFLPRHEQANPDINFPATASGFTNPISACIFVGACLGPDA